MGNTIPDKKLITDTAGLIAGESIELIDFDKLENVLVFLCDFLDKYKNLQAELDTIKADYRNRILGMLKANLACRPDHDETEWTALLSDDTSQVSCGELIKLYRKASARFRDNFPASFRYITSGESNHLKNNWEYHKI